MNSFLGTSDLGIANKSIGTGCVIPRAGSMFSISFHQFRPFCRASSVDEQMIPKTTFLQTFDDDSEFDQITHLSKSVKESTERGCQQIH